ncbi:flavodoxin domain-containing protein [Cryobacterium sp. TMS1-13-1]|uniref:flavodoxin family protein n=1 Tax=Cryobacterium sp. TMS1-13-1 TaxID=1259220 RepID=UPI00106A9BA0|nr:flavodoxin domain-containing protein [Cryobacterium sp. TMS1-13-1]TFD25655.1 flavodoxin family protein [Cryobacterium sp. TMS1-13-1]
MRALIVYESMYGNTRLIAETIGRGLAPAEVILVPTSQAAGVDLTQVDLLLVGGPTHVHGLSRPSTDRARSMPPSRPSASSILKRMPPAEACGNGSAPCPIWLRPNHGVSRNLPALRTVLSGCRR